MSNRVAQYSPTDPRTAAADDARAEAPPASSSPAREGDASPRAGQPSVNADSSDVFLLHGHGHAENGAKAASLPDAEVDRPEERPPDFDTGPPGKEKPGKGPAAAAAAASPAVSGAVPTLVSAFGILVSPRSLLYKTWLYIPNQARAPRCGRGEKGVPQPACLLALPAYRKPAYYTSLTRHVRPDEGGGRREGLGNL